MQQWSRPSQGQDAQSLHPLDIPDAFAKPTQYTTSHSSTASTPSSYPSSSHIPNHTHYQPPHLKQADGPPLFDSPSGGPGG
eukprot:CAMPEP_0172023080 /NCGR_PEP_ID=MMETSP1041-20130122/14604_1 /TAXON_ID=464988 /ORGANISM="Hemiselmis andersenii, Strain CCMP439" /LENGTH=80 /DNA_ID=CAMNT_0012678547 /DNA_START=241 /DNA_END=480 /DNA_ORIENTATION=+